MMWFLPGRCQAVGRPRSQVTSKANLLCCRMLQDFQLIVLSLWLSIRLESALLSSRMSSAFVISRVCSYHFKVKGRIIFPGNCKGSYTAFGDFTVIFKAPLK
ncbi:hypothetical protein L1049_012067 [Liquidambar formosana]|uniref:Uncharacterized protein n=1 Tax=Liquidambar formosana TaxID=63359 RepID=A0AAP0RT01_LIQFO